MGEDFKIFIKFYIYRILSRIVKGMQTSVVVVVVVLIVCFFLNGSVLSFLIIFLLVCIYMYLFILLFLFCFCSLKPLTTVDNVQIIHLHKSIQFTLALSKSYLKQRSQR